MGFAEKHLMTGENIIFRTKLNWTRYLRGLFLIFIGLLFLQTPGVFGVFVIFLGLIILGISYLKINTSEFVVTNKRVLIKVGILKTNSFETLINKIEGIHVEQGIVGKMVNSGSVVIKGTGGTNNLFPSIDKPFEFRNAINGQISNI